MKTLIVAKYQEDTSWTEHAPVDKVVIITKDVDMPNVGREPSSFLHYIVRNYNSIDPEGQYFFVQGRPFDHCRNILEQMGGTHTQIRLLGSQRHVADAIGAPDHPGIPLKEAYEKWIGEWPGQVDFVAGGQFVIVGSLIKSKPQTFYIELLEWSKQGNNPWILERLWKHLWQKS